jgi:cell shape-determining protein MreD
MIPNLCLIVVIFLGACEVNLLGAVLAFMVGLLLDLSSGQLIGPWSGAFAALFGVLSQGGRKLFLDSWLTIGLVTFVSGFFCQVIYLFLLSSFRFSWSDIFSWTMFGTSFVTAILAPGFFLLLKGVIDRRSAGTRYIQQRLF